MRHQWRRPARPQPLGQLRRRRSGLDRRRRLRLDERRLNQRRRRSQHALARISVTAIPWNRNGLSIALKLVRLGLGTGLAVALIHPPDGVAHRRGVDIHLETGRRGRDRIALFAARCTLRNMNI